MGATRQRPPPAQRTHVLAALFLALAATLPAGCGGGWVIERPRLPAALGPEVDSVVVRPFEAAPGVEINAADLALFTTHLGGALADTEHLRTFEEPPTRLPNTAVLRGRLERLAVNEQRGDAIYLRTIELAASVQVLAADGEETGVHVERELAWQKVYPGGTVSALALDLEDAARELTRTLALALAPQPEAAPATDGEPLVLRNATFDGGWLAWVGLEDWNAPPALLKGNRLAVGGRYDEARLAWQAALFDPAPAAGERTYRVTEVALNQLRAADVPEDVLERLQPLTGEGPLPLVPFRRSVREALGAVSEHEGLILTLADAQAARTHRVLAAAHTNLGHIAVLQGRRDLAAFHWGRAWAHDPDPALLERWRSLQADRNLLPGGLTAQEALEAYLRIPPPGTARVRPGRFERSVLPPPAFAEAEDATPAATGAGAMDAGAEAGGAAGERDDADSGAAPAPQPVALPPAGEGPADPTAPDTQEGTARPVAEAGAPNDSTPGRAAGSGPSGPAPLPEADAPAAPQDAPAAR